MNEFFKRILTRVGALWAGWSMQQRVIISVVAIVVVGGVITLFKVSSTPAMVSVIDAPIRDEAALDRIVLRLNQENVRVTVTPTGMVQVPDEASARRLRTILISEDLIPNGVDPWQIFDKERWTITDFERNVNFQRAQQRMITEHIKAIDAVDDVSLTIVWPKEKIFLSDQNPASASVVITPKPGSKLAENRKQIEGIQGLLKYAIEGLQDENILIVDRFTGVRLNDFEAMKDFDRLTLIEKENKIIQKQEAEYRDKILNALRETYSSDRVRDLNVKFDIDMSKKTVGTTEYFPVTIKPPTPGLPYDDSILRESIRRSESEAQTTWKGSGIYPEGPPGVEGQAPPAYKDMSNLYGEMSQHTITHNEAINERGIQEEVSPSIAKRVTVSVNIDGTWSQKFDEKGNPVISANNSIERIYTPISEEVLRQTEAIVKDAIGFNSERGDSVTVRNIQFDRTEQFRLEDAEYFRKKQIQTTIIIFISGLTLLLFGLILFRMISREMERRRRLAEEERARREQMLRESAMAEAEQEGMDVSISLEERNRMELMESAINMAKEHPEDAAQLIRTWLLEE
jgi:flagellar M-ring protein FliF